MDKVTLQNFKRCLGYKIKEARHEKGLTQENLAELSDLSVDFLAKVEIGYYVPSTWRFIDICNALNITTNHLLYEFLDNKSMLLDEEIIYELSSLDIKEKESISQIIKQFANLKK